MKTTLIISGKEISISAKLIGKDNKFNPKYGYNYVYNVTVSDKENKIRFKFNTSISDHNSGKNYMDESDLKNALECLLMDASSGDMSFYEFCREFGYNEDSKNAEKIHKACVKQKERAAKIFDDIYETANELNELVNG